MGFLICVSIAIADSANPDLIRIRHEQSNIYEAYILIFFLAINFVINSIFIFFLTTKNRFKSIFNRWSLLRILILSVLGIVSDTIGVFISELIKETSRQLYNYLYAFTLFISVFVLVSMTFYWLYSKKISNDKKTRIIKSIIFGILSNPVWLYLLFLVFDK